MLSPKKIWYQAQCWVTEAKLLVAQSAFLENGAIGLEIDDGVLPEGEKKYKDDQILVKAFFDHVDEADLSHKFALFFSDCRLSAPSLSFFWIEEEDWQGRFVRSCTTFMVPPDIFVVPSFDEDFKKNPKPLFVEIDPENAFGTGQHQTTKLCLTALRGILSNKSQVFLLRGLDVGTGSGILSILMKKLGMRSVLATDTDEDAIVTAQKNAQKNGVCIEFLKVSEEHTYEKGRNDVVVANILANVLIEMAKNLAASLKNQGVLVLSGILISQQNNVIEAYEAVGLRLVESTFMDDWCALVFIKNGLTFSTGRRNGFRTISEAKKRRNAGHRLAGAKKLLG